MYAATGTPASVPSSSFPAWPGTVGAGNPGSSSNEIAASDSMRSAAGPRPDPRIIAIKGATDERVRTNSAASSAAWSPGDTASWGCDVTSGLQRLLDPRDRVDRRGVHPPQGGKVHAHRPAEHDQSHE